MLQDTIKALRTEKIADGVYIIKVPLPGNPLKNVNDYFIEGRDRNLLIDTAFNMPVCQNALNEGLKELGVDMCKTDIFLTHLHSDHTGLAHAIAGASTRVFISGEDRVRLENFMDPEHWESIYKRNLLQGLSVDEIEWIKIHNPASIYLPVNTTAYTDVEDNQIINLGDRKLRCISTPGHTPGHMCLYDEDRKILFSGDHIIFGITPNITSWANFENPLGRYLESLERMKSLDVSLTLSAHRQASGDCLKRIDELILHHKIRLEEAYNIVHRKGRITSYEAAAEMTWSIKAKNWADFPITQKWFAVGEATSHLEYFVSNGKLTKEFFAGKNYYSLIH